MIVLVNRKIEEQIMDSVIVEHFSKRVNNYGKKNNWVSDINILNRIKELIPNNAKIILDEGAGTGAVSCFLEAEIKDCNITAIDTCQEMLESIKNSNINKVVASVDSLPFDDGTFDLIVSRQCFHYVKDLHVVCEEIKRVLKPGGVFILAQIVPYDLITQPYWEVLMRIRQELRIYAWAEEQWLDFFKSEGFLLLGKSNYMHESSVETWKNSYSIDDKEKIKAFTEILMQCDDSFKKKYNVKISDGNIFYNSYWLIASFCIR